MDGTMGPDEMVRMWNAAHVLKVILTLAVWATAAALSVMVNDVTAPVIERAFEKVFRMERAQ